MHRVTFCSLLLCLLVTFVSASETPNTASVGADQDSIPVTTSSPEARHLFEQGMLDLENQHTDTATQAWRAAVKVDPNFALAHLFLSYESADPAEQVKERARAKALASHVTRGELLMIGWLAGVRENDYMHAIADMNDLLQSYPKDKRLMFLAGRWLITQQRYEQGQKLLERVIAFDANYPAVLNELGYTYALTGNFRRATELMDKYVGLVPEEANPQDSYAEIMRMSGNFELALRHYRAALKLDPTFYWSQLGLADTYALMGDQPKAREEYAKAIQQAKTEAEKCDFATQSAITWMREGNHEQADKALLAVARRAQTAGLLKQEARAYRMMAMGEPSYSGALAHLKSAEAALNETRHLSRSDRDEELAEVLRVRVVAAQQTGNTELAQRSLKQLEKMAQSSRSEIIERSYHAAAGMLLAAQGKYAEAVRHLEEDSDNAITMKCLMDAYEKVGDTRAAQATRDRLEKMNKPTIEQALVVPRMRATLAKND